VAMAVVHVALCCSSGAQMATGMSMNMNMNMKMPATGQSGAAGSSLVLRLESLNGLDRLILLLACVEVGLGVAGWIRAGAAHEPQLQTQGIV